MLDFLASVRRIFILFLQAAGRLALFAIVGISHCFRPPFYPRLIGRQLIDMGYYSLPVVGLTAIFTGMVLALQTHSGFAIGAETAVATVVVLSVTRELGPVIAGLMVAGRIGAAIAADIIGVFGGFLVATYTLDYNPGGFLGAMWDTLKTEDIVSGLVKSAVFGFIVALLGCYHGYHSKGGAQGVGAATTYAVVSASIMILVTDYVLTALFFSS